MKKSKVIVSQIKELVDLAVKSRERQKMLPGMKHLKALEEETMEVGWKLECNEVQQQALRNFLSDTMKEEERDIAERIEEWIRDNPGLPEFVLDRLGS